MECAKCGQQMVYDFRIYDKIWAIAWKGSGIKKPDGVLCAHCCLTALGPRVWSIALMSTSFDYLDHINQEAIDYSKHFFGSETPQEGKARTEERKGEQDG